FAEVTSVVGAKSSLPCNTSIWSADVSLVIWYRGITGKPLYTLDTRRSSAITASDNIASEESDDTRFTFDTSIEPPSLVIDAVNEEDEGEYRCRIDYRVSRTRNYVIRLHVLVPPKEVIIMDEKGRRFDKIVGPIDEGSDLIVICEAYGKPQPSVTWWTSDKTVLDDSYSITVQGASRNEYRLYSLNRSSLMLELTCLRPLEVKIISTQNALSSGRQASFECQSFGSRPRPLINWWIGSIPMIDIQETISNDGNLSTSVLSFTPSREDNGKHISCRVENPAIEHSAIEDKIQLNAKSDFLELDEHMKLAKCQVIYTANDE
ncbi:nephrin-like protein, partial [Dinothrombium tinctorium]